jgi:hypothetical protein
MGESLCGQVNFIERHDKLALTLSEHGSHWMGSGMSSVLVGM